MGASSLLQQFKKASLAIAIAASIAPLPAFASSSTYGFGAITSNSAIDPGIGEAQLFVEVYDTGLGAGQAGFRFYNTGPLASSITDVYFDDGTLLGISSVINMLGVSFTGGSASPPNLPSGNNINFNTSAGFLADSDAPAQPNGVNPGEELRIIFNLINGTTYNDLISALELGLDNPGVDMLGGLRIGIHVQGFADGQSEAFVNGGCVIDCRPDDQGSVPEPGTLALIGVGLMGLAARRKS
ncbi:MAG: PEP-CTERM sorting domain-containing protein [Zoogloeaceae bacterium]|nr:PEP-CTERM sorting domain-containing protein [Zoogloeaceae bacterium]